MRVVTDGGDDRGRTVASIEPAESRHRIIREIDGRAADVLLGTIGAHRWPENGAAQAT